jgi:hypothetical protein
MSWKDYVASLNEVEAYQKKVRQGYVKDRDTYYQGPQDPGEAYPNKPKRTRSKSAPPGFGAIGEEVEEESFQVQETLQPDIWEEGRLRPDVRERLMEITEKFVNTLQGNPELEDLRFTGSLANYNWSDYSDLDLHLVIDFSAVDANEAMVKSIFDEARMTWNNENNIEVHGFEVELYIENLSEVHQSGGVYSVLDDVWLVVPEPYEGEIDFATARKKSDDLITQINLIGHIVDAGKLDAALKSIARLKKKIKHMRRAGLESAEREFSPENIAFKILRRDNALGKLNNLQQKVYDNEASLR